jgi:hypothetical protein
MMMPFMFLQKQKIVTGHPRDPKGVSGHGSCPDRATGRVRSRVVSVPLPLGSSRPVETYSGLVVQKPK